MDKVEEFVAFACSKSQNSTWESQIGMNHAVVIPHDLARLLLDTQGTKHDGQTYYHVWTMKDRHYHSLFLSSFDSNILGS